MTPHDELAKETPVQRHRRIRGSSQTDAIEVSEIALHAVPTGPIDWGAETVHPLYVTLKPGEISYATPIAGRMSYEDWLATDSAEVSVPSTAPDQVIRDLIFGRIFPSSAYAMLGAFDLLPVMCEAEVLDLVGIAAPSALHIRICTDVLREHLGEPQPYRGRNCWPIFARFNDSALDETLAKTFPVPVDEKYVAVHPLLDAAESPREEREFVQALRMFTAEVDHTADELDD